jgi:hypothetical protein
VYFSRNWEHSSETGNILQKLEPFFRNWEHTSETGNMLQKLGILQKLTTFFRM